ncbi:MAG: hypothetical protein JXA20_17270 [Spirochaetes bacterium]|nr:hypothetical protein [Spirochaetota bacterium]
MTVLLAAGTGIEMLRGEESGAGQGNKARKTIMIPLKLYNCPDDAGGRIGNRLRRSLDSLEYCELIGDEKSGTQPCLNRACAVTRGRAADAAMALYGYVAVDTDVTKKRLGDAGIGKYILKVEKKHTYTVTVKLVDVATGEELAAATERASPDDLDRAVDGIADKLRPHFTPVETDKKIETVQKGEDKEEPARRDDEGEEPSPLQFDLGLYFSIIAPVGSFKNVATWALGNTLEGRMRNLPLQDLEFRLAAGYCYLSGTAGYVTLYKSLWASLFAGYRFTIMSRIYCTPLLGVGYHLHRIRSRYSGSSCYGDPMMALRIGIDVNLYPGLFLTVVPGYVVFFEKSSAGMYPVFDLGVVYGF